MNRVPGAPAFVFVVLAVVFGARTAVSESADEIAFFESRVRPILAEQCYKCHSAQAKKLKGGLRLDSREGVLKGGDTGPAIVPRDPDKSLLIQAVRRVDKDLAMPPDDPLPAKDVETLTVWVKMGAPWPAGAPTPAGIAANDPRNHWAFRPVKKPVVPSAQSSVLSAQSENARGATTEHSALSTEHSVPASPIDVLAFQKLREHNLTPSPPADRRTLIRRATFDLTGLPPTADEIDAFEKDNSPDAFAKVVDRLLASPRYGERWGRYWLDVARYADHKGYLAGGEERRYPFAYTYRDWVIRAFNADMPYDRFLINQIAADQVVTGEDKHDLAAMGFLTVGRRFLNNTNDIIDDRLDVIFRGAQGLTIGCARCHNHKFDPIPTADYYSLYGVFASSQEPKELPLLGPPPQTPEYQAWEKEALVRQKAVDDFTAANPDWRKNRKLADEYRKLDKKVQEWHIEPNAPPRGMVMEDKPKPVQPQIFLRGNPANRGETVPRQFLKILSGDDRKPFAKGSGRLELAQAIASRDNPLTARVFVNRVWVHHFGKPLVRTPSDFGVRTEPPVNPELLDFLAAQFMDDGWSVKKLHRFIMLSAAYQQSSDDNASNRAIDPENQFLWRFNRQRLDFEALRDSMLAVAGQLDVTMGGPSVPLFGPEAESGAGLTVKAVDKQKAASQFSRRRSVYAFIDRQNLPGIFRTFDFASPDAHSPQRFTTTVPQQALFMMNSPFVIEQARSLTKRAGSGSREDEQIQKMYSAVYGRAATPEEIEAGANFLHAAQRPEAPATPVWQYGYGDFDSAARRVNFTPLTFIAERSAWQVAKQFPDPKLGYISLTKTGGHPGRDAQHGVIRRWTAPRDGDFAIDGTLVHPNQNGDGVRGRIVSSRHGELGSWVAKYNQAATHIARIAVQRGDTIDFIVDCRENDTSDGFSWTPIVHALTAPAAASAGASDSNPDRNSMEWSASSEFSGPARETPKALTPWEKYAQVLLAANEFVFVD
jgi:uncharacterized protein DUF1553/uncharacterized protein DUF1549/cytochrome c